MGCAEVGRPREDLGRNAGIAGGGGPATTLFLVEEESATLPPPLPPDALDGDADGSRQ